MNQIEKNSLLIVAGTALFMIMFGIGSIPLLDPDEPVYAETAREMLAAGDFLSPRIFGNFWYDKPPMYYWLVAVAQFIFGDSEFAARFPAALMACGTSVMMYVGITRLFNERAGFWSAMILTSCVEFFYMGKAAVTDTTLLFSTDKNAAEMISFLHRNDVKVPEDISVAGIDDDVFATIVYPTITTMKIDVEEKANMAVEILMRLIQGESCMPYIYKTKVQLIERESVKKR